MNVESTRLAEAKQIPWRKWGPYLSERQWGTVREDVSADGNAWNSFSHDQSRSRTYRWGGDGLAGFSDDPQRRSAALGWRSGNNSMLTERVSGATNDGCDHGDDCKGYACPRNATPIRATTSPAPAAQRPVR